MNPNGILQAATTIAKTTQTAVGSIIPVEGYGSMRLYLTYVKGDETGLDVIASYQRTATGTAHPNSVWSETGGVYTRTAEKYRFTASANATVLLDIRGANYVLITQGGSNNDGTPTGTLAASYALYAD